MSSLDLRHIVAVPFEQDEEPLASPFGLPELQNMDVPMRHHPPSGSSLLVRPPLYGNTFLCQPHCCNSL